MMGMPAGRPSIKTDEMIDAILDRLADGESLRSVCRDEDMPDKKTVMRWLDGDVDFATKYARAKDIGMDQKAERLEIEISEEQDVARARLKLDFAKWYLSKLAPKRYGEKVALIGGDESDAPIKMIQRRIVGTDAG